MLVTNQVIEFILDELFEISADIAYEEGEASCICTGLTTT
jgi:hypothetical protein